MILLLAILATYRLTRLVTTDVLTAQTSVAASVRSVSGRRLPA